MEKNPYIDIENFPKEITSKYEIIQEIGRGAFSIVYKVRSKENNNIYCLKKINTNKTKDKENEIKILSNLSHPNLIKCFYSFYNSENIYIIMDFCEFGDLFSLLQSVKKKKVFVNEDIIWNIAIQVLIGLNYLHSKKIIHRDIKLLNLFMTKEKKIKIGDMGMSTIFVEDELIHSRVGTPLYIAPELVKKEKYDYKVDIWSLGCSLYHLAKTSPPFNDENLIKLGNSIINDQPPNLPICYSDELYEFILRLMIKNKDKRPSAFEALESIPENIKKKFYKNYGLYNSIKKKKIKLENYKLMEKQNIINKMNKFTPKLNDDNNNTTSLINIDKYISKSIKNDNKIGNKYNNELISGQTFYQFFKVNSCKNKNIIKNNETSNKNNKDITPNSTHTYNTSPLLSKTMIHMKEKFYKFKKPENNGMNVNIINNIKQLKLISNLTQEKLGNIHQRNSFKEFEGINNTNKDTIEKDKNDKINEVNNNNDELLNNKENKNHINKSDILMNNFDWLKFDENKNIKKNIAISLDKSLKNQDINTIFLKKSLDPIRTFSVKEGINKNNSLFSNKMKLINKKYLLDNKKDETIFPKIPNRYKYKSSSIGRLKNFQDLQNFGHTGYHSNFRNKLTIHDLK